MWTLETYNDTRRIARVENLTGSEAIRLGRIRHNRNAGRVYVFTPTFDAWLIRDNGLTRVGF
jgi:hypothetical protein